MLYLEDERKVIIKIGIDIRYVLCENVLEFVILDDLIQKGLFGFVILLDLTNMFIF